MAGCFGDIVANALLAPEGSAARADAERQMTCKLVASTHCMCACGSIFDQSTVCILERTWDDGRKSHTVQCCPSCRATADNHLRKLLSRKMPGGGVVVEGTFAWLTWDAQEEVLRGGRVPEVSDVEGLKIVRQDDVVRGTGKYRIVHVASDRYLSEHTSKKAARQLLAQLKGKADWTLPMRELKDSLSDSEEKTIGGFVKYYSS
jgi:hypothetical protein